VIRRGHTYAGRIVGLGPDRARFKGLFEGPPKPPAPPPPQPMPDLMDPAVMEARKRTLQAAMGRSGRASTNLTGDNGDYSTDKLGSR
jgi:hypothetical protein